MSFGSQGLKSELFLESGQNLDSPCLIFALVSFPLGSSDISSDLHIC